MELRQLLFLLLFIFRISVSEAKEFRQFRSEFIQGYEKLNIPEFVYDYCEYFNSIPSEEAIKKQKEFFTKEKRKLAEVNAISLGRKERVSYSTINYEIDFNLYRIALEEKWIHQNRPMPVAGLHSLPFHKDWYQYFIKKFTSTNITAEEVFQLGKSEVARVKKEINGIMIRAGFSNLNAFYDHLNADSFYLKDKTEITSRFRSIDSTVRINLNSFVKAGNLPPVYPMEWPGAGAYTPRG